MKKIIITLSLLLSSNFANAGLYDFRYLEPVGGCVVAGAAGYLMTSDKDAKVKNAAIYCGVAAVVTGLIYLHYDAKYGSAFVENKQYLDDKIVKMKDLENRAGRVDPNSPFATVKEFIKPRILPNGQGIDGRVKSKLVLKDEMSELPGR